MDFTNIKPRTKEEYLLYEAGLAQSSSLEEAKKNLPEKLFSLIEAEMAENKLGYEQAISNVKQYLSTLKDIKVYLAFEPSRRFREKVLDSLEHVFKTSVVEFVRDSSIIGGAKMAIDGKFFDKSLSSLLG